MADDIGRVTTVRVGSRTVVAVSGEIDVSNVAQLAHDVDEALPATDPEPVIDLSGVTYLDSTGIQMLFTIATRLRTRRRQLHVIAPPRGTVRRMLELVDLARLATIDDALHHEARAENPGNS